MEKTGESSQTVSFEKHQKLLEVLDQKVVIEVEKIIKIDELPQNSILCLTLAGELNEMTVIVLQALQKRYAETLVNKNITVVLLNPGDTLESLPEAEMKRFGWEKKSGLIITPENF